MIIWIGSSIFNKAKHLQKNRKQKIKEREREREGLPGAYLQPRCPLLCGPAHQGHTCLQPLPTGRGKPSTAPARAGTQLPAWPPLASAVPPTTPWDPLCFSLALWTSLPLAPLLSSPRGARRRCSSPPRPPSPPLPIQLVAEVRHAPKPLYDEDEDPGSPAASPPSPSPSSALAAAVA